MKNLIVCLSAGFLLAVSAIATPDHSVMVEERFFGSNATHYAVLRTEDDNQCSYYKSRVTTWLDECAKDDVNREEVRSTLLLDVTRIRDASHNDPDTPVPVTGEVNVKDTTLHLAELLERYPTRAAERWTAEQLAKMNVDQARGIYFRNRQFIASGAMISMLLFGQRHVGGGWTLDGVSGDGTSIYLELSSGQDQNRESRLMCLPPGISKKVRDQLDMQPLYLVTGSYDTKEAARTRLKELRDLARERKIHNFRPEIWSCLPPTDKTVYLVADRYSSELIKSGQIPKLESVMEVDFQPMSSERFIERIPLVEGEQGG